MASGSEYQRQGCKRSALNAMTDGRWENKSLALAIMPVKLPNCRVGRAIWHQVADKRHSLSLDRSGRSVDDCLRDGLLLLLARSLRKQPSFAGGQLVGARAFAFSGERWFAHAFDPQPPRRIGTRTIRVALARKHERVFRLRRERRRRQLRDINGLSAARGQKRERRGPQQSQVIHNV